MTRILASVSFLLLAITFGSPVFATVASSPYVDSKNLFSINPPSGWTTDSSGAYGTAVILYGPTDFGFRINMNVVVHATPLSLSDFVAASKTELSYSLTNYRLDSETSKNIGGLAADELVINFTAGASPLKDQQDILVQNGKAYVITSTAFQTDYNTYQPSFAESVQTFQVTTAPGPALPWLLVIIPGVVAAVVAVGLAIFFVRRKSRVTVPPSATPQPVPSNPPS